MVNINIEKSLHEDIIDFCKVNQITDVDDFINKTLRKGFDLKKYGESFAMFFNKTEADMIFNGPEPVVEKAEEPIVEPVVEEKPKKKGGRKKKVEEPEPTPIEVPVVDEQPKEPTYEIKKEEEKPVRKPVTLVKKQPKDNYDVYDEI
jgi:hypothetical protein